MIIWNYKEAAQTEKQLKTQYKRDFLQIYKSLKQYFRKIIVDCEIFAPSHTKQNMDSIKTLTKFFYYLLVNDVELIKGEDILKFVKEEKKINIGALYQYAKHQGILLNDELTSEVNVNGLQFVKQNQNNQINQEIFQDYAYRFMLDTLNSGQHDVALVMNLLLALKISQQDLFELNYQNIQKEDNYCIIYLQNKEKLILKRENLLPELQMKFWGNIGSIFNVVEGQQSNKRNKINEQFNETRKILINNLEKSEKDQTYQNFLLQINLNNYKMMDKTNLRIFKLADNDLQKLQEQKKEIQQLKQASKSDSKQEKALQKIPNQESIEAQCKSQVANQKVQPVQQIQNKTK